LRKKKEKKKKKKTVQTKRQTLLPPFRWPFGGGERRGFFLFFLFPFFFFSFFFFFFFFIFFFPSPPTRDIIPILEEARPAAAMRIVKDRTTRAAAEISIQPDPALPLFKRGTPETWELVDGKRRSHSER